MLMFMTISPDGAFKSTTPGSSHLVPGALATSPDAVKALVGSSDVPLAAVDLPSGRFMAVNPAMASALSCTVGALDGSSSLDWLSPMISTPPGPAFRRWPTVI